MNRLKGYLKVIYCKYKTSNEPVLILTMGKVGSSSVYETLKNKIGKCSVFHVHFLSDKSINKSLEFFKSKNICTPYHVAISMAIRKLHDKNRLKYISLVREPISRIISDYFQNYEKYHPELLNKNNNQLKRKILEQLENEINSYEANDNYEVNWINDELIHNLDINIYKGQFNNEIGYKIYNDNHTNLSKLLVIRLDALDRVMKDSIREFLGMDNIVQINANVGKEKKYKELYKYIKENLSIDKKICERIYSTEYVRYFYTQDEIDTFIKQWT